MSAADNINKQEESAAAKAAETADKKTKAKNRTEVIRQIAREVYPQLVLRYFNDPETKAKLGMIGENAEAQRAERRGVCTVCATTAIIAAERFNEIWVKERGGIFNRALDEV